MEKEISSIQNNSGKLKSLLSLAFILALLTAVVHLFRIEYLGSFDEYFPFVAGAILLHNIFPFRFRKYLFSCWTLIVLALTAGPIFSLATFGIILIAAGISFIPKKIFRNLTATFLFACMVAIRMRTQNAGFAGTVMALAGIFIMLRFIFLLYEISFIKVKPSFLLRMNYLFMLPNIFFPLFPIVDPLVFFKHKEEDVPGAIEQGKTWLVRGILHLLFYRFIYLYVSPSIYELNSWFDLLVFILSGYSLILRLSGIFYLSGGILGLMGYQLPPVFENYFLVRNFRDLWRRINLYWRHFMWRVFYYPMIFRLKRWPQKRAVLFTVLVMFGVTWLLHGWQWYWVKGIFPLVPNDILYWSIFGIILAFVSVRAFSSKKTIFSDKPFVTGIGIVSMFFAMSLLWSLWTASSLTEWLYIMSKFSDLRAHEIIYLIASVAGIFLFGGIASVIFSKIKLPAFSNAKFSFAQRTATLILLVAIGLFYSLGNHRYELPLSKMADPQLNMHDRMIVERGYYEQLLTTPKMSQEIQPVFKKAEVNDFQNVAYQTTDGLLPRILKPNFKTTFKGKIFTTNSFGMRDKQYALNKKEGVYRICLLGGSYEMGSGVADGEPFEQLIEDSLNKDHFPCEIFNMGVGGYYVFQMLKVAEQKCLQFHPDAMIYVCHSAEGQRMLDNILSLIDAKKDLEFPVVKNIVEASGIIPGKMCRIEMYDRLLPYTDTLMKWAYSEFARTCRENNIQPIWIYLPAIGDLREHDEDGFDYSVLAHKCGMRVVEPFNIFSGYEVHNITVSDEDTHPNALGHEIIFKALYPEIKKVLVPTPIMPATPR